MEILQEAVVKLTNEIALVNGTTQTSDPIFVHVDKIVSVSFKEESYGRWHGRGGLPSKPDFDPPRVYMRLKMLQGPDYEFRFDCNPSAQAFWEWYQQNYNIVDFTESEG